MDDPQITESSMRNTSLAVSLIGKTKQAHQYQYQQQRSMMMMMMILLFIFVSRRIKLTCFQLKNSSTVAKSSLQTSTAVAGSMEMMKKPHFYPPRVVKIDIITRRGRERVEDWPSKNSSRRTTRSLSPYIVSEFPPEEEEQREKRDQNDEITSSFRMIEQPDQLWARVLRSKYKVHDLVPVSIARTGGSRLWQGIRMIWSDLWDGIVWNIGDGSSTKFWLTLGLEFASSAILLYLTAVNRPFSRGSQILLGGDGTLSENYFKVSRAPENQNFPMALCHGRILSNEERSRRHLTNDASCAECGCALESFSHIFVLVHQRKQFGAAFGLGHHVQLCYLKLWKRRNQRIFDPDVRPLESILDACRRLKAEAVTVLSSRQAVLCLQSRQTARLGHWMAPMRDWFKIYTDSAYRHDIGLGFGSTSNNSGIGLQRGHFGSSDSGRIWGRFLDGHHIQELVKHSWEVRFVFAPREHNLVADCMSNLAWKWAFGFHVFHSPPVEVGAAFFEDSQARLATAM
ncbi:hypothetical protein F3Y22_tig00002840pilonHSYRG01088 [Hibiscus syriacus]|uniref:RNase H type-1 domain-containing protein n=1 Tax=Hibiscus syriacus TaxID=106335 RepID=A0A6A3CVY1_HIBSY|nr:hypothetical protein F3Y22_tig00002840pilonHSYRG01088 [Hibiscus syriacus]